MSTKSISPQEAPRPPTRRVTPGHLARRAWTAQREIEARKADTASLLATNATLERNREKFEAAGDLGRARLQQHLIDANQARIDANRERIRYLEGEPQPAEQPPLEWLTVPAEDWQ